MNERIFHDLNCECMRAIISRKEHLYRIDYYRDKNGKCEFEEYLNKLINAAKTSKTARIRYNTIERYLRYLKEFGTSDLPADYAKLITDSIWELRPDRQRIFYFFYKNDTYVLLHHFEKKSQKTPRREIEKAIRERNDYVKRNEKI